MDAFEELVADAIPGGGAARRQDQSDLAEQFFLKRFDDLADIPGADDRGQIARLQSAADLPGHFRPAAGKQKSI